MTTYYRYTNNKDTAFSNLDYAEFVDNPDTSWHYGDYVYTVDRDDLVDIYTLIEDIAKALEEDYNNCSLPHVECDRVVEFALDTGNSYEDIANSFAPDDIVDSADMWDNAEMVMWFCNRIAEPNNIKGIYTADGAIVFDDAIITALGNKNNLLTD